MVAGPLLVGVGAEVSDAFVSEFVLIFEVGVPVFPVLEA